VVSHLAEADIPKIMKNNILKLTFYALVAAALAAMPSVSRAEDNTNAPASAQPAPKKATLPFKGKVTAVDTNAMTFSLANLTLNVTSATKIAKGDTPAVMADITVGATVTGSYKKDSEGKLNVAKVKIVEKAEKKKKGEDAPPQ
jgi:hypothetical protein